MHEELILLVDDEPELLSVCKEALEEAGYRVVCADNGHEALRVLDRNAVALVITDLSMPKLDGMGLLRGIVDRSKDTDVIFLTGYGTVENAVECLQIGACDYLLKPFDFGTLLTKVRKVLSDRATRHKKQGLSNLLRVYNLSGALREQHDMRSLLREFLVQVKQAFRPDGLALQLTLSGHSDGGNGSSLFQGPLFNDGGNPQLKAFASRISTSALEKGEPLSMPPDLWGPAFGPTWTGPGCSALAAPITCGPAQLGCVCVVRKTDQPPYGNKELQLLSVFAAHAGSSIENIMAYRRLRNLNLDLINSYVHAVEAKDVYTRGHSERVSVYAARLGEHMGLSKREVEQLRVAGMLHDIGKIGIPDSILNKPDKLSAQEYEIMKTHPAVAKKILSRIQPLKDVLPIIYHHHEHYDGSGYPDGLAGKDIPLLARIISVADGFEAMTSNRSYKPGFGPEQAKAVLIENAGSQWDPQVVEAFTAIVGPKNFIRPGVSSFAGPLSTASA